MTQPSLAIHYHRAAYQETASVVDRPRRTSPAPAGLMGREVASSEFLGALLRHGRWSRLDALLAADEDRQSFAAVCHAHLNTSPQQRHVRLIPSEDYQRWFSVPTSEVLHFPYPPDDRFAQRRAGSGQHALAFSGVTHTLSSLPAMQTLWRYHRWHWQPYDRLICTSRAVEAMVRDTAAAMQADALQRRGVPTCLNIGLEVCPLGVDLQKHRPARPDERFEVRRRLGITMDKLVVLFTGRLSHHSKAHPYPMFVAAEHVAQRIEQEVVLVLCGWFSNDEIRDGFARTARRIAPHVRLLIVDGMDPWWRQHAWHAADIFVSLADSIQETFGLTPLEAMARALPVVASDWNGYRDTIQHEQTGLLVPTTMIRGAGQALPAQLAAGDLGYDQFLARVGQTVSVSIADACRALLAVAQDAGLRQRLGQAGRERAERLFDWASVIARYESIWETQRHQLACARREQTSVSVPIPAGDLPNDDLHYPPIETAFQSYPTAWLDPAQVLAQSPGASQAIAACAADPLCNHSLIWSEHFGALRDLLLAAPGSAPLQQWQQLLAGSGIPTALHSDIVGWMCKYGILVVEQSGDQTSDASGAVCAAPVAHPLITFATTCKGRLDDLQQTLPITAAQADSTVVVVDYSCPQQAGQWVRQAYPAVRVVWVPNRPVFDRSEAKNAAALAATTDWICLLDADIVLDPHFVAAVRPLLKPRTIVRSDRVLEGTGGTFLCEREMFQRVGGHDPVYRGWGEQDEDLVDALKFAGCSMAYFPADLLRHRHHDDAMRVQFHDEKARAVSHTINRIYRCAKWDWSRIAGAVPPQDARQRLHQQISEQVGRLQAGDASAIVDIELGSLAWNPLQLQCRRRLQYRLAQPAPSAVPSNVVQA